MPIKNRHDNFNHVADETVNFLNTLDSNFKALNSLVIYLVIFRRRNINILLMRTDRNHSILLKSARNGSLMHRRNRWLRTSGRIQSSVSISWGLRLKKSHNTWEKPWWNPCPNLSQRRKNHRPKRWTWNHNPSQLKKPLPRETHQVRSKNLKKCKLNDKKTWLSLYLFISFDYLFNPQYQ